MIDLTTPVYLNKEESEKFITYMKHYEFFNKLIKWDIPGLTNVSVTLDIDGTGTIKHAALVSHLR